MALVDYPDLSELPDDSKSLLEAFKEEKTPLFLAMLAHNPDMLSA